MGCKGGTPCLHDGERRPIRSELIYDFVEGYDQGVSTKDMVCPIVQGQRPREIKKLIHEALEFVSMMDKNAKEERQRTARGRPQRS